ncbi:uncharacterized protein JCM6883_007334 [Sporobolomyces salmoneus]|uniref:uncharacterized protein n=1 Tax=Sporobolomyces salmoneus TaxID=183962 RepID=UPI00317A6EC0
MDSIPSQGLPDSYDFSQSQFTQTQPQTQPDTQPPQSTTFPSHLWGILLSSSGSGETSSTGTEPQLNGGVGGGGEFDRPTRLEFIRPSFGGKAIYTIGRNPKSDLRLNSPKVSNHHARITISDQDGLVRLEDLSTNGTHVKGIKIGKNKVTILEPGDSIIFGPATIDFGNDFRYIFQSPPINSSSTDPYGLGELSQSGSKVFSKYEVREQIGKGSFASVRKGVRRSDGTMVAIKIIQKARFANNPKTLEMFAREITIIQQLDHPFCVKCYDWFEDEQRIWIVLEYVDGGDLLDYTMKKKGLPERETREIALMVCQAVSYLHSVGITHRDLKPENLLLTKGKKPVCKVTDFGLAKMVTDQTMLKTMCGTPTYLAPEVILNTNPAAGYSPAVDAWSIGVVLYSLLTCQTPFDESESTPLPERMRARQIDFNFLVMEGYSPNCIDFLRRLLVADPRERMSCDDAIKHPWLEVLPQPANGTVRLPPPQTETMSASNLLNGFNARSESIESSPAVSTSNPPVAGLGSAISLDQSPRPKSNGFEGEEEESEDSVIDSQAIGNLRLSRASSPALAKDSVAQMPPPPPHYKSPLQPIVPLVAPSGPSSLAPPQPQGIKRKEPESAFSDSSLSDLSANGASQNVPSQANDNDKAEEEDVAMKEGSGIVGDLKRDDSPEAPPSINGGNGSAEDENEMKKKKGESPGVVAESIEEETRMREESIARESSPISSIPEDDEEEEEEVATPARRRSSRASKAPASASTQRTTPASSARKPRSARVSTGSTRGRRRLTPQEVEDADVEVKEAEVGGIAAGVKNRRRKAARLT